MLDLLHNVAEKHSRKLLVQAMSELGKTFGEKAMKRLEERCSVPPFQEMLEAVQRVRAFVGAISTILMVGSHNNDIQAVSDMVQYKGNGMFERNVKSIFTVQEAKPEGTISKDTAAKLQIRMDSRTFWREASADVLKTAASASIQAPKLALLTHKLQQDDCPVQDLILALTELPQIRAGMRKGSCKAIDARLATLVETRVQELVDSDHSRKIASKDISVFTQALAVSSQGGV